MAKRVRVLTKQPGKKRIRVVDHEAPLKCKFSVGDTVYTDLFPFLKRCKRIVTVIFFDSFRGIVMVETDGTLELDEAWYYRDINGGVRK